MLTAADVMTPCPVTVRTDDPLSVAASLMSAGLTPIRHLPVLRGERLVGMLSDRDLARAKQTPGLDLRRAHVESAMTEALVTVRPRTPLRRVIARLVRHRVGAVPVVDGDGVAVGMVSVIDAVACLGNFLARMDRLDAMRPQEMSGDDVMLLRELSAMFMASLPDRMPMVAAPVRRRRSFATGRASF